MIKSMTGYGRASVKGHGEKINVEIKSLNSRYLDIKFLGININPVIEQKIKTIVSANLKRGNIKIHIDIDKMTDGRNLTFNKDRFKTIHNIVKDINKKYGEKISLSDIINTNDIITYLDVDIIDDEKLLKAVGGALNQLNKMRLAEGKQINTELLSRIKLIKIDLGRIKKLSSRIPKKKSKELTEKIKSITEQVIIDKNRLMQEVAYLLERSDITEEIVRANIHVETFIDYLKYDEPVGKRLSFLIQELNREVNTIGSKSILHEVTGMVVEVKNEIEKIREQVQNIL
ncbi:MAG: YicC family protein [bacterium TMED217]|nr:MAG: YicC family protein [bacterium TMED217]